MHCPLCLAEISPSQSALLVAVTDPKESDAEIARLTRALEVRDTDLAEAHRREAATADVLNVISRSPTDVQPVFDAIIASALRLCGASMGAVYKFDGELVHLVTHRNYPPEALEVLQRMYPRPPQPDQVSGRAILARTVAQIEDMLADPLYPREMTLAGGWRSILAVPMLRDGVPSGAIVITRAEAGPFAAGHIELLTTFADQAVIAIENTRLFEEVQARTRELQESLEYQTATSDVLNVISRSPNELQPVLDTIAGTARRLCPSERAAIWRYGDDGFKLSAHSGIAPEAVQYLQANPIPKGRASLAGRSVIEQRAIHFADVVADPDLGTQPQSAFEGLRTMLTVPLLRKGQAVGVISLGRREVNPFTDKQIEIVTTFANQAVIAINNVGLFDEVQARTKELQEFLEYQTATSEVLGVISRSPNELQPVLDTIARTAQRLCQSDWANVWRLCDSGFELATSNDPRPEFHRISEAEPCAGGPKFSGGPMRPRTTDCPYPGSSQRSRVPAD